MAESPVSWSSATEGLKLKKRMGRVKGSRLPGPWMVIWGIGLWLVALRYYWSAGSAPTNLARGGRSALHRKQPHLDSHTDKVALSVSRLIDDLNLEGDTSIRRTRDGGASSRLRGGRAAGGVVLEGSRDMAEPDEWEMQQAELALLFDKRAPLDPRNATGGASGKHFHPGRVWLDTDGNPIQAHGGGMLYVPETKTFYWYGEIKRGGTSKKISGVPARVDIVGVGCYSSQDLWAWKNEGVVLKAVPDNPRSDLHPSRVLERPKVIYNDRTHTYVMWMHIDNADYKKAAVGVATSENPEGPFSYVGSRSPHRSESRDMTVFKDDDGQAYIIYSSEDNSVIHIGKLTPDYLDLQGPMVRELIQQKREAPAVFKHRQLYYMITSGCSGWMPNKAEVHVSYSMMGPWFSTGNPCVGDHKTASKTFMSQGTFVLPLPGSPSTFIFMADRWKEWDLEDSRYIWLPLTVKHQVSDGVTYDLPTVTIEWFERWRLPENAFVVQ